MTKVIFPQAEYSVKSHLNVIFNSSTKRTTWDDPRRRGKAPSRKDYSNVDELGPLPEGWEQRKHHDGRTFFIDHVSTGGAMSSVRPEVQRWTQTKNKSF